LFEKDEEKIMIHSETMRLFCLAGLLCCVLTPTQASPKADAHTSSKADAHTSSKAEPSQSFAALPFIDPEEIASTGHSLTLTKEGDGSVQRLDWQDAKQEYQQALDLWPNNLDALYGLAKCSQAAGDMAKAVGYYHQAIYSANPADKGFRETHTNRLMEFALLLNKAGQTTEAMFVYNHAASALDYQDSDMHNGKPYLKVLLPELAAEPTSPEQVQYTPERLQALANTALAHEEAGFGSEKEAYAHTQEAVKLYPDSAVTHYYRGEVISGPVHSAEAKAEYQKALDLGDDATVAAAKERMSVLR